MLDHIHTPYRHPRANPRSFVRLAGCLATLLALNGCAALAVSLAGAGAGAGLSHQMNGTASRTFSAPFRNVDDATRIAARRMHLEIDEVATIPNGQITKARVSDMTVTLEMETLSPNLTRIDVVARKDLFRVDAATAQEIVQQIERALVTVEQLRAASAGKKSGQIDEAKFVSPAAVGSGANGAKSKLKNAI